MTSEEWGKLCRAGDLLPLWEQVSRFVRKKARAQAERLEGYGGVTWEDLYQAGFLAVAAAAETYDPEGGKSFPGWLMYYLRKAFAQAAGYQSQKRDPLQRADSLDRPIDGNDPDGDSLGDLIASPVDEMAALEDEAEADWRREVVAREVARLPDRQGQALRLRYWEGRTLEQTAAAFGVYPETVRQWEKKAFRTLRRSKDIRAMRQYVDLRTDYYRGGFDPVGDNAVWREELGGRWMGTHNRTERTCNNGDD
ncbi:MAG: sigma-70 family RNA polymerase sigma factor [Clostridiales bacterium]|nr:sigma-70 family RNA polymerase sigma factor [Clostridiales bacterium]